MASRCLPLALALAAWAWPDVAACRAAEPIDVFIRLIEKADTPTRQAGVLRALSATEGQMVKEGDVVAQIDDTEAGLQLRQAELELWIAREQSESNVTVRAAQKVAAVAHNDYQRALRTNEKNPNAISASEVEHLKLTAEKAALDIEDAERDFRIAQVNREVKENQRDLGAQKVQRHQVVAPLSGMVVEVYRQRGEWLEPGEKVVRIVRLDRLRAEGFVDAKQARPAWIGMPVVVSAAVEENAPEQFTGKIVFVSPEIDPVNGQVAVWAEVANRELRLRPGLRATMTMGTKTAAPQTK